jgi:hypothetical protein
VDICSVSLFFCSCGEHGVGNSIASNLGIPTKEIHNYHTHTETIIQKDGGGINWVAVGTLAVSALTLMVTAYKTYYEVQFNKVQLRAVGKDNKTIREQFNE